MRPFTMIAMFAFPALAFVLQNCDGMEKLFRTISWCTIICGVIFFVLCVFFAPLEVDIDRYKGVTWNANVLGMYVAMMLTSATYLISISKGLKLILLSFGVLLATSMLLLSESRTSTLIGLVSLAICLLYIARDKYRHRNNMGSTKQLIHRLLAIVLACAFCFTLPVMLLSIDPSNKLQEATAGTVETVMWIPDQVRNDIGNQQTATVELASFERHGLTDRVTTDGKTLDELSSGRISLWKETFLKLNLRGHDPKKEPLITEAGAKMTDAHLVPLTIGYISGILAGIAYLLFEVYFLFVGVISIFQRRQKPQVSLFLGLAVCAYFIVASLEVMYLPFYSSITFCVLVAASLFLFKTPEVQGNHKSQKVV
jgi:hypothetical protein